MIRWITAALALLLITWSAQARAGQFQAGAARADITPDLIAMKIPSAGYGARGRTPMTGVHDHVFCKALVVSDGTGQAAIVTCDLIGISPILRAKVLDQVADLGLDDHNLMMTASHTHSGPGAMQKNFIAGLVFGRYNEKFTQQTADRVARAIREAHGSMTPALMSVGTVVLSGVSQNRRDPAGSYDYDTRRFSDAYDPANPENLTDQLLTTVRFDSSAGQTLAVLFSFAAHGTVMGADNLELSADWPGAAQARVEQAFPGAVGLFVNGAIGDQAPAMQVDQRSDWEYVDYIGSLVGGAAVEAARAARPVEATPVRSTMVRLDMPPAQSIMGYRALAPLLDYYFPELPLQAVRIGDVALLGAPLEMVAELGLTLREGASGQGVRYPIVAGLANATLLYCAAPSDFPQGGYEVDNTIWGETEAGIVIGEQMLLVRELMDRNRERGRNDDTSR